MSDPTSVKKPHVAAIDKQWLDLTREAAVEPTLPIIDSHIHLWDFSDPPYFGNDFVSDAAGGHDVQASVYVECTMAYALDGDTALRPVGETRFAVEQALAHSTPRLQLAAAILGAADLSLGADVRAVLEAQEAAGQGRWRGVRVRAAWDADPVAGYGVHGAPKGSMLSPEFRQGVKCLASKGMVLEIWAFHTQMDEVVDLARAFPDQTIVVNHVGGPLGVGPYAGRRDEVYADWAAAMRRVGTCPNVHVKLGGLGISRAGFEFDKLPRPLSSDELAQAWGRYVQVCIEAFTPKRAYFGSNFPVDKAVCHYGVLLNAFKKMTAAYSADERRAMFAGNARALYRL